MKKRNSALGVALIIALFGLACITACLPGYFRTNLESPEVMYRAKANHDPDNLRVALDLAVWYLGQKEYVKAELEYKAIIKRHGDVLSAHYHLGESYYGQGRTVEACNHWRKVLKITDAREDKVATSWRSEALMSLSRCKEPQIPLAAFP